MDNLFPPCLLAGRGQLLGVPVRVILSHQYHHMRYKMQYSILQIIISMQITCDMWAEAQERWERGDGGRIDDAQESPEEDGDDDGGDDDGGDDGDDGGA